MARTCSNRGCWYWHLREGDSPANEGSQLPYRPQLNIEDGLGHYGATAAAATQATAYLPLVATVCLE
jgi:hypothetical protein